jgi:hypothetical protein
LTSHRGDNCVAVKQRTIAEMATAATAANPVNTAHIPIGRWPPLGMFALSSHHRLLRSTKASSVNQATMTLVRPRHNRIPLETSQEILTAPTQ